MPEDSGGAVASAPSQASSASEGTSNVHNVYMDRTPSHESNHDDRPNSAPSPNGNGERKELSRYERTKRQRQEFQRQQQLFAQEREQFLKEKSAYEESKKPKRNYTFQELQQYRADWAKEAEFNPDRAELVQAADKELALMQQEEAAKYQSQQLPVMGTAEHRAQWEKAEQELYEVDPEFMRSGTVLDNELRALMNGPDGNIYRQHPRGIIAAYHRAKMSILERQNAQLKEELQRYQGYTSIGGGAPGSKPGGGRVESLGDFSKLSSKEQKKHLLSNIGRGVPFI